MAQLNCPGYNNDIFKARFSFFLVILIEFAFVFSLVVNLGYIVVEKQSKMKVKLFSLHLKNLGLGIKIKRNLKSSVKGLKRKLNHILNVFYS